MLNFKQVSQSVEDCLSSFRKQNKSKFIQKDHNDSHIFQLKTTPDPNINQQIFSLNFQHNQNKNSRLRIRIKSKKDLQHSLNLKQNSSGNSSPKGSCYTSFEFKRMNNHTMQRQNVKIDIKDSFQSNIKRNVISFQNVQTSPNKVKSPKVSKKIESNRKRNYFNVNEFIQNQELKKNQNTIVMMRGNMNSALKRIKQNSREKIQNYSKKMKSMQFNAIQISKSIVQKSTSINDRVRFKNNNALLKPNYSFRQTKPKLQNLDFIQEGSKNMKQSKFQKKIPMQRSNSYQVPKKSRFFEEIQKNENQIIFPDRNQNIAKREKYDNLIQLNPWSHGIDQKLGYSKNLYMGIKTQRIEHQKRKQDEHEFINYYIKTSRQENY